jgi:hypothetical protein
MTTTSLPIRFRVAEPAAAAALALKAERSVPWALREFSARTGRAEPAERPGARRETAEQAARPAQAARRARLARSFATASAPCPGRSSVVRWIRARLAAKSPRKTRIPSARTPNALSNAMTASNRAMENALRRGPEAPRALLALLARRAAAELPAPPERRELAVGHASRNSARAASHTAPSAAA